MTTLVLEALCDSKTVPIRSLLPNQSLTVGRTAHAEHEVQLDGQMSRIHFYIENSGSRGLIRDLNSTNGTYVNGVKYQEASVEDGDIVMAGETAFLIRITKKRCPHAAMLSTQVAIAS